MFSDNCRNGIALVTVLWVIVILMIIVAGVTRSSRLDMKVSASGGDFMRCKWACRAGVEAAAAVLAEDLRAGDSLTDTWTDVRLEVNEVSLDRCEFDVNVVDEAGKLNINTATKNQIMKLPYMTEEIADAIMDWRDSDDTPGESGAEGGYYENLPFGYKIRNGFFRTTRELLRVKGVTEQLLYGMDKNHNGKIDPWERLDKDGQTIQKVDEKLDVGWFAYLTCYSYESNVDAGGTKRTNINEADENKLVKDLGIKKSNAKWIVQNKPKDNYKSIGDIINDKSPQKPADNAGWKSDPNQPEPLDIETFSKIADKITVDGSEKLVGKVNINTAPEAVLEALFESDQNGEQMAKDIVLWRQQQAAGMESIADVMQVGSVKADKFKVIANSITVRSNVFMVTSSAWTAEAGVNGVRLAVEAVLDRSSLPCKTLYWSQGASN